MTSVKATANRFAAENDPYVFMQLQANPADQATILAMSKLHISFATELISRLNERERDPFETAAWAHMEVVKIHPFADANGRTARLLATIILMQAGHKAPIFASDRIYTQAVVEGKADPAAFAAYLRTVSQ